MNRIRRALLLALTAGVVAFHAQAEIRSVRSGYASVSYERPSAQVEAGFFYNQLSPYGRWIDHDYYGPVWTPRVVRTGWRPYTDGRWVDSDYGWTWASDEPFGWATYHYGRWVWDPDYGWIWLPGSVWGPAWVSWQEGDGYIGWAPLPPDVGFTAGVGLRLGGFDLSVDLAPSTYVFVPERSFLEPRLAVYAVAASRNVDLCRRTRNVTRYGYSNNRVFNGGLSVDRIERVTRRRVERLRVQEVNSRAAAGLRGRNLQVFRPGREQLRSVRVAQRNDSGVLRTTRRAAREKQAAQVQGREQQRLQAQQQAQQRRLDQQRQAAQAQQQRREAARQQQTQREQRQLAAREQQQRRATERREEQQQATRRQQEQRREAQQRAAREQQQHRLERQQAAEAQQQRRAAQRQAQEQRVQARQEAAQRQSAQRRGQERSRPAQRERPRHKPPGPPGL